MPRKKPNEDNTIPIRLEWVKLELFCSLTGETRDSVHQNKARGEFLEGVHVKTKGNRTYVNLQRFYAWVENDKPAHLQAS